MLNLPGPRHLGPALASGAVYIASLHDSATEIVCFRGNMADSRDHDDDPEVKAMKENVPVYPMPVKGSSKGVKEKRRRWV